MEIRNLNLHSNVCEDFLKNLLDTEQRDTFVWERSIAADSDSNCLATAAAASS